MGIRTVCFALAGIFAIATDWTIAAWVCVVAAALLPYPAVVFANNVDRRRVTMEAVSPTRAIAGGHASAITGSVVGEESHRRTAPSGEATGADGPAGEPGEEMPRAG